MVGAAAEVHPELENEVAQRLAVGRLGALGGEAADHVPVAHLELGNHRLLHVGRAEQQMCKTGVKIRHKTKHTVV